MTAHLRRAAARPLGRRLPAAVAALLLVGGLPTTAAAGDPPQVPGPVVSIAAASGPTKPGYSKLVGGTLVVGTGAAGPSLVTGPGRRTAVFVQLSTEGAAQLASAMLAAGASPADARRAVLVQRVAVGAQAAQLAAAAVAADPGARVLFTVTNAVPGLGLLADPAAVAVLAARAGVAKISAIVPKFPANAGAAQLTRALETWTDVGATGTGIRVGVIDTGIDYTHADFGGAGTVAAYRAARAVDAGPWQPNSRVVGGTDFVGDSYDAAAVGSAGAQPAADAVPADAVPADAVPRPDPNPLDCNGHGTHVAGTVAGSGVDSAGRTFTGSYSTLSGSQLYAMDVGPGMAPQASLFALKVFGCSGSTDAVIPALDWSLDPNGDGDFSDHLNVVDLSLTSERSSAPDPETAVLDVLAEHGVLPVVAIGNGGDDTDAAGSLAGSVRALAVASSVDAYQQLDGLRVLSPGRPPVVVSGQVSAAYHWAGAPDVTGAVVSLSAVDADGCTPLSAADASTVGGRVAWLSWDDDDATRQCTSAVRAANVRAAGGIGVLLTSGTPVFAGPISGDPQIPVFQLTPTATAALAPAVDGGLQVTFSSALIGRSPEVDDAITDMLGTWSARGPHAAAGLLKPDLAAPGDTIASAAVGTGNGSVLRSGTSMAAAAVAGLAALVEQAQPGWTAQQVKAALVNTADHDLYTAPGRAGPALGPERAGSGRVDVRSAISATVLAYSATTPGAVGVSFGVVPADIRRPVSATSAAITLQNTGSQPAALTLRYAALEVQPGVSYQVSPGSLTLAAGSSATATVTIVVTTAALRHTLPVGSSAQQANVLTGLDEARQYVASAAGRVVVSSPGMADARVPVFGAAKPVSATTAVDGTLAGRPALVLSGTGVALGSAADPASTGYQSLVSVLDLGYRAPAGSTSGLQAVGAGRSAATSQDPGYLWFGLAARSDWANVGRGLYPTVDIDTDGDGDADYTVQVQAVQGSDLLYALLFDDSGPGRLIGITPVNFNLGDVDTNVFDTNVLLIPIDPAAIGYRPGDQSFPIGYSVGLVAADGAQGSAGLGQSTPAVAFDLARPAITTAAPLWQDQGGTGIPYVLAPGIGRAPALVLHLDGATGARDQVVQLTGGSG